MKWIYALLCLSLLITACKGKTTPEAKSVEDALTQAKTNPNDSTLLALDQAIDHYVEMKGYGDSTTANFLVQAARTTAGVNQPESSFRYYTQYMAHYPGRADQADKLAEAITIMEKLNEPELSQIAYKSFVSRFPNDNRTADLQGKISAKDITVDSTLRYIGMNMFNDSSFRLNEPMAMLYIEACELVASANPALPNAPEYLHLAAETARTLRDIPRAIDIYNWIIEVYPDHNRAATSLFLKAFTYDNDLKDFEKAGKYYNEFLTKYPNNEFAESAKFLLEHLGKSEEELKKILEKKAEEVQ